MSIFDDINARADANKAAHQQRLNDKARDHFDRHPELTRDAEGQTIDIDARCWSHWWLDAELWDGIDDDWETVGRYRRYETAALRSIRDQAGKIVATVTAIPDVLYPSAVETIPLDDALADLRAWWFEYLTARQIHTYRQQRGEFFFVEREHRWDLVLVEQAA